MVEEWLWDVLDVFSGLCVCVGFSAVLGLPASLGGPVPAVFSGGFGLLASFGGSGERGGATSVAFGGLPRFPGLSPFGSPFGNPLGTTLPISGKKMFSGEAENFPCFALHGPPNQFKKVRASPPLFAIASAPLTATSVCRQPCDHH